MPRVLVSLILTLALGGCEDAHANPCTFVYDRAKTITAVFGEPHP
jgi:hypothetical protein